MKEAPMRVTLTEPAIAGEYVVVAHDDSRVLLERDLGPSAGELHARYGTRPLTAEEFERFFGDLPRDPGE